MFITNYLERYENLFVKNNDFVVRIVIDLYIGLI